MTPIEAVVRFVLYYLGCGLITAGLFLLEFWSALRANRKAWPWPRGTAYVFFLFAVVAWPLVMWKWTSAILLRAVERYYRRYAEKQMEKMGWKATKLSDNVTYYEPPEEPDHDPRH